MKIQAQLSVELVAVETAEELSALIELTAPEQEHSDVQCAPSTLVVVLDRSGSMDGERLEGAKDALLSLLDRLAPTDSFGLVTFDDSVRVDIPAAPVSDKATTKARVRRIESGGSTNLSAGYLRGLQEARRAAGEGSATVLLISDGHANAGVTDPDQLADVAVTYGRQNVTTSALGFGLGCDETLLAAVARGGRGNELFAENADQAGALIAGEVSGLLSQTIQAASLTIRMSPDVMRVMLANDLPVAEVPDGLMVELGGFWAGEERKLLLTFDVPGLPSLGLAEVASLELRYVDVAGLKEQLVTIPLHVNVVPGDQAAGRIPNPIVVTEMAFQQAQKAKRSASRRLSRGDSQGAARQLKRAGTSIHEAMASAPPEALPELAGEAELLEGMLHESEYGDLSRAAKWTSSDAATKSRTRGRKGSTGTR
jgi:Ca-activated chloride channel family protein